MIYGTLVDLYNMSGLAFLGLIVASIWTVVWK